MTKLENEEIFWKHSKKIKCDEEKQIKFFMKYLPLI